MRHNRIVKNIIRVILVTFWTVSSWLPIWIEYPIKPSEVKAITCGFGTDIGGGVCRGFLTLTGSVHTWTSPSDWNNANNYIEVIGGGGSGGAVRGSANSAAGGGGGAYSRIDNFVVATPGTTTASYRVGSGGTGITLNATASTAGNAGGDTWFNSATFPGAGSDNSKVGAKGGTGGTVGASFEFGGAGGSAASGWGQTKYSGGSGGNVALRTNVATGGGGAAGNIGNGVDGGTAGANSTATNGGDANVTGAVGGSGTSGNGGRVGGTGGTGVEWQVSPARGSGAGGGGARSGNSTATGGPGGNYGGGGGGAARNGANTVISGAGIQGLIVITYTPIVNTTPSIALNTIDDFSTSDSTPSLEFTGTDADNDSIRYQIQVDALNTFNSDNSGLIFSEDFNDNLLDTVNRWYDYGSGNAVETGQQLEISSTTTAAYYNLASINQYNLTSTSISIELVSVGNQSIPSFTLQPLMVRKDGLGTDYMSFEIATNQIAAKRRLANVNSYFASTTYNGTTMRWLRIREASGTSYWEYSSDGSSWSELYSETNPFAVTSMDISIMVGTWQNEASTSTMTVDNLGVGGAAGPLISAISGTDSGFDNQDTPADTDPFNSAEMVRYTVQEADLLSAGVYYWRVRASDPSGTNTYSDWSATRTFTITAGGTVSITITTDGTVPYGTVALGQNKSTIDISDTQTIQNNGDVAVDLDVKTGLATGWTLGASAGTDIFTHEFSANGGSNWTLFNTVDVYQTLATNKAVSSTQNLDLRITVPTSTASFSEKTISVTIKAVQN